MLNHWKFPLGVVLTFIMLFVKPTYSGGVEFGNVGANDENALSITSGASAFLFEPRIVLTAAHGYESWGKDEIFVETASGKKVKVHTLLIAESFRDRVVTRESIENKNAIGSRLNDFAVMVLSEPITMSRTVRIAEEIDLARYVANNNAVQLAGYGFYDSSRRKSSEPRVLTGKLVEKEIAKEIFDAYYKNGHQFYAPPNASYELSEANVVVTKDTGSACDNDSGSGWYVLDGDVKVYIGPMGSHTVGTPNCGSPGSWGEFGNVGAIEPAYKHLDLIDRARKIAAKLSAEEDLTKEYNTQSFADSPEAGISKSDEKKAILKIKCVKGKKSKIVRSKNLHCPKGWKKVA